MIFQPINISKQLTTKSISLNGSYNPIDDGFDGFSMVQVRCHPGIIDPYVYDFDGGYVSNGVYTPGGTTVSYSDIYRVEQGKHYVICLGEIVGTRFRSMFTNQDVTTAEESITGEAITNTTSPRPFMIKSSAYSPVEDGYIIITKDNTGVSGLKTYLYCIEESIY